MVDYSFSFTTGNGALPQPPIAPNNLTITRIGNQLELSWDVVSGADSYKIYRAVNNPYFAIAEADAGFPQIVSGTSWTDTSAGIVGDINNNYYYFVTAVNAGGESGLSNRVGEFDFELIYNGSASTNLNAVALVLTPASPMDAAGLMSAVPNCDSVSYWDAALQGNVSYSPPFDTNNFPIVVGNPYFVNVTAAGVWTQVGGVPVVGEPIFTLVYNNPPTTSLNGISLKLNKESITYAEDLVLDVPNCSAISYWDAGSQGYISYSPPFGTSFPVKPGYPYFVTVTAGGQW